MLLLRSRFGQLGRGLAGLLQLMGRPSILVVDDDARNRKLLIGMLAEGDYDVRQAADGHEALAAVSSSQVDLILLDVMMPGIDGLEVCRRIKSDEEHRDIPVVMVTALNDVNDRVLALEAGADDFLSKPVDRTEMRARVRSLLKIKNYHDRLRLHEKDLARQVQHRTEELQRALADVKDANVDTVRRLARAAEYRDDDTGAHILRIGFYSASIGRQLGLSADQVEVLLLAAPMHDVGKIGVPDQILLKPGRLDADEWLKVKAHSRIGHGILEGAGYDVLRDAATIALTHHEKWDGSGYPDGLAGDQIPLSGRIVAVADVFDALISEAPSSPPRPWTDPAPR